MERISGKFKWAGSFAVAAALLLLVFWLQDALLLSLLALILGILFYTVASFGHRRLKVPYRLGVIIAVLLFIAALFATVGLVTIPLLKQGTNLIQSAPEKMGKLDRRFDSLKADFPWLEHVLPSLGSPPSAQNKPEATKVARHAILTLSSLLEGASSAMATLFLGIFLAWDPKRWATGVARLIPLGSFERRVALFKKIVDSLQGYLLVYGIYILAMGVLWGAGLWLVGIDYWLVFGLLGGIVEIVPYLGPVIAFIPPLLVALAVSPGKALGVTLLYILLHIVEGYILVPVLMQKQEHLPPPLIIFSVLACGTLFGFLGVVLAVPLATISYVLANELVYKRAATA